MLACGVALEAPSLVKIGSRGGGDSGNGEHVWKTFQRRSELAVEAIARTIRLLFP
jgi:hypothetical protein